MSKKAKKIFVNCLTLSRVIGALFLPIIFSATSVSSLIVLLIVLFITDFLDGKLSRRWHVKTVGGRLLDPFGDKVLALSCILALIKSNNKMVLLFFLECTICILNIYRTLVGENVKSSLLGKLKTWILSITLILGAINLFNANLLNDSMALIGIKTDLFTISDRVVFIAFVLSIISEFLTIVFYFSESMAIENKKRTKVRKFKSLKEIFTRLFDEDAYESDKDKPLVDILMN